MSNRVVMKPGAVVVLAVVNLVVFLLWNSLALTEEGSGFMASHFLVSGTHLRYGYIWTLVTSAFSHVDGWHFLFNMLALWVFGRDVEKITGTAGFLHLYLAGGILASLGHVAFNVLTGDISPALGASGSVMAIAVVYGVLFPRRILMINFFIPVPAGLAVLGYVLLDIFGAFSNSDGIAHAAHLGGAAYGLLYYLILIRPRMMSSGQAQTPRPGDGLDVVNVVTLSPEEARSGKLIEVITPDGPTQVRIPPNLKPGTSLRLARKGRRGRGGERGDFYVQITVR